jgi:predicted DNA-binding transcriptional regulator AlpA
MQRIAVPMIGGVVSSTVLTLIAIPAIYGWSKTRGLPKPVNLYPRRSGARRSEGKIRRRWIR